MGSPLAPQTLGRYRIYGKIASGGMATVHLGLLEGAAGFSRVVAIKRLHPHLVGEPEFTATLVDEARLVALIRHPNVVPTLDVVALAGELLVVMEYVRGVSLAHLVRAEGASKGRIPLPIVSAIAVGALHGLHAAHEARSDRGTPLGIVHRDVSPQNVLVGTDGVPRVIDFGVAKAAGRITTTRDGVIKGKLSYMAPEQLGREEVTRRADVYAMAVVLWEMLTGRRMLQGSERELIGQIMAGGCEPPSRHVPGLPPELDGVVMKGLAKDPEDRFDSAREMADALMRVVTPAFPTEVGAWVEETAHDSLAEREAVLTEVGDLSRLETATNPTPGARSRTGRLVGALAVAVVALAGGVAALIARRQAHPAQEPPTASSTVTAPPIASVQTPPPAPPTPSVATSTPSASVPRSHGAQPRPRASAASVPARSPAPTASDPIVFTRPD
jgi:serine/threonine protein kinase